MQRRGGNGTGLEAKTKEIGSSGEQGGRGLEETPLPLSWAHRSMWLPVPGPRPAGASQGRSVGQGLGVAGGDKGPACLSPSVLPEGSERTQSQVEASDLSGQADLLDLKV